MKDSHWPEPNGLSITDPWTVTENEKKEAKQVKKKWIPLDIETAPEQPRIGENNFLQKKMVLPPNF